MNDDIDRRWARDRVTALLSRYAPADACAAELLCDGHDQAALAYRVIAADLSARDISYGELRAESERFAAALAGLGIGRGDRVATLMGKSRSYLVTLMGIWRLGAVHVPLFTAFAPPAIAFRLNGSGAKIVVCDHGQRAKLLPGDDIPADAPWRVVSTGAADDGAFAFDALMAAARSGLPAVAVGGDAPIIHIFTSGTTGSPKGVLVPLRAIAAFRAYAEFALDLRPDDLYWCGADPGWAYGLYFGVLASLSTATPSVMLEAGFTPETTLAVLSGQPITNFAAAPTVYRALLGAGLPIAEGIRLRCASSAGEPLTPDVNLWATGALGIAVHDHYGQTETGMLINNHHHSSLRRTLEPCSMGHVMPGWAAVVLHEQRDEEVAPGTVGRVAMLLPESPLAWFSGYAGNATKSAEKFSGDGRWYLTGDTGSVDAQGYFRFSARDDDVIIMAGYRIGPAEIEAVLATHEAVAESAVIAVPDVVRGEVMEAFVVLHDPALASLALEKELQSWVKTRYAAHAFPRIVHFAAALPKTPSGKIQRFLLKQQRRDVTAPVPSDLPVYEAVVGRRSVRRFLPDPVAEETIGAILAAASRAASGVNMQPWLVHVVTGATRDRLARAAREAAAAGETSLEYGYLPERIAEPYLSRRRKLGYDLYALYGIERHDMPARQEAMLRNYDFFGAPVGLFFTMDRAMSLGSWLDCGMFMQNVMIVARAFGLETCPQQAWCDQGGIVHRELGIPDDHILLSGMALGRPDPAAPENGLVSERAPVADFTTWHR